MEEQLNRILHYPRGGYIAYAESVFCDVEPDEDGVRRVEIQRSLRDRYMLELAEYDLDGNPSRTLGLFRVGYERVAGGAEALIKSLFVSARESDDGEVLFRSSDANSSMPGEFQLGKADLNFPEIVLRGVITSAQQSAEKRRTVAAQMSRKGH